MQRFGLNIDWVRHAIVWFLAAIVIIPVHADSEPVQITDADNAWTIGATNVELSTSIPPSASTKDVLSGTLDGAFAAPEQDAPKLDGYGETVWGRVKITNAGDRASNVSLVVKYPQLNQIEWFVRAGSGLVEKSAAGQFAPRSDGQIASRLPLVSSQLEVQGFLFGKAKLISRPIKMSRVA